MKTITLPEFETLLAAPGWQHYQDIEKIEEISRHDYDLDGKLLKIPRSFGWASVTSKLDGVEITYTEGWNMDDHMPDSLTTDTEGQDTIWEIEGLKIVDEDGDEIGIGELSDYLSDAPGFDAIDYESITRENFNDLDDTTGENNMQTENKINLPLDYAPTLRFSGELIGRARTYPDTAHPDYSGSTGLWQVFELYKTTGGKLVCYREDHTLWQGDRTKYTGAVCDTPAQVIEFFGQGRLAHWLYDDAGIENVTDIA